MAFEVIDTTGPKVLSISNDLAGAPTDQSPILYTFNFSEPVVGFGTSDIVVDGGLTLGSVTKVTDTQYQAFVVPSSDATSLEVSVSTGAGAYKDLAGNDPRQVPVAHQQELALETPAAGQAGDATIDLGSFGQLIAPIQVEGNWYYLLDKNKSGSISSVDTVTMNSVESYVLMGSTISTVNNVIAINGVTMAVPNYNKTNSGFSYNSIYFPGTRADGMESTSTYDGLLAIWDLNNGAGTGTGGAGIPRDWSSVGFSSSNASVGVWTATPSGDNHATMSFHGGEIYGAHDSLSRYLVLQVL